MFYRYISPLLISLLLWHNIDGKKQRNNDFDFFIFAQIWPMSSCILWEERDSKNTCSLGSTPQWTVHGVWPTKNRIIGPIFCDDSRKFDEKAIEKLVPDLTIQWTNIRENSPKFDFWEHEWTKHGTCATEANIANLTSEYDYFKKGLDLNTKYPLLAMLNGKNIKPGKHYSADKITGAIKSYLNTTAEPGLECVTDRSDGNILISQINLCFDKKFNLMSCENEHGGLVQHCGKSSEHNEMIYYPETSSDQPNPPANFSIFGYACLGIFLTTGFFVALYYAVRKVRNLAAARAYERI